MKNYHHRPTFQTHYIKRNKRLTYPKYVVAVDTETDGFGDGDITIHKLKLGWVIYEDMDTGKRKEMEFKNIEDFYSFLISLRLSKKRIYIFAHNFDFDAQVLDLIDIGKYMNGEIKNFIVDGRNFIIVFKHIWDDNDIKTHTTYVFISTTNYFKNSLKELGKLINLPKLQVNFNTVGAKELSIYCHRDTEIVLEMVKRYIEFIKMHDLGNFQFTIASQSFNAYRHRFMKHKILIHNNRKALDLEIESYRGGRTEAWRLGDITKYAPIYNLDINSLYPYMMLIHDYPIKLIKIIDNPSLNTLLHYSKDYLIIAKMDIEVNKPIIGIKMGRLIFPTGKISGSFTSPEIELILKYGKINKIYKMALYEHAPIFKKWVTELYNLRRKYKEENNQIMQYFVKKLLNSLYGKFGQKVDDMVKVGKYDLDENWIERVYDLDHHRWIYRIYRNGEIWEKQGKMIGDNSAIAIASFVTAYGRCYLWKLIEKAGKENVFYMDTDSLFVNQKGYNNLKGYLNDKEIGKLKLVEKGEKVIIHNVKDYEWNGKIKKKGIKRTARKIGKDTYEQEQFIRLKGNLTKYHQKGAIVIKVKKQLKNIYKKGNVMDDGKIIPYHFETYDQFKAGYNNYQDFIDDIYLDYKKQEEQYINNIINSDKFDKEAFMDNTLTEHENIEDIKRIFRDYKEGKLL